MKKIILIIFFILFYVNIYSQVKVIAESDYSLKNKISKIISQNIKSITTYKFDMDNGKIENDSEKINFTEIDKNNFKYTDIQYSPVYSKTVVEFDENINIKQISIYYEDGTLMSKVITNYNSNGLVKEKIYYFGNMLTFKAVNEYDAGQLIKQNIYDSSNRITSYSLLKYDGNKNLTSETKYNSGDTTEMIYTYSYDKKNNCIEERILFPSLDYIGKDVYKYNSKNQKTEYITLERDSVIQTRIIYSYDGSGNLTGEVTYKYGVTVTSINNYFYDNNGNMIEAKKNDKSEGIENAYRYYYGY